MWGGYEWSCLRAHRVALLGSLILGWQRAAPKVGLVVRLVLDTVILQPLVWLFACGHVCLCAVILSEVKPCWAGSECGQEASKDRLPKPFQAVIPLSSRWYCALCQCCHVWCWGDAELQNVYLPGCKLRLLCPYVVIKHFLAILLGVGGWRGVWGGMERKDHRAVSPKVLSQQSPRLGVCILFASL